jgi:hypothetical protein
LKGKQDVLPNSLTESVEPKDEKLSPKLTSRRRRRKEE